MEIKEERLSSSRVGMEEEMEGMEEEVEVEEMVCKTKSAPLQIDPWKLEHSDNSGKSSKAKSAGSKFKENIDWG